MKRGGAFSRNCSYKSFCDLVSFFVFVSHAKATSKQHRNHNSHETTTFGCCNPASRGPKPVTTVKRRLLHLAIILVAHDCGYPLSRYTCRATRVAADFLDFIVFCRCSTGVALHPLKILVSHLPPPQCREVSHRNLGLKRCRATQGCRSYSCGCRATLCN